MGLDYTKQKNRRKKYEEREIGTTLNIYMYTYILYTPSYNINYGL